jgi:uncharacterized protein YndB with AHSA1/START domain
MVSISAIINAPIEKVWNFFTIPEHITQWNQASADWHTPRAEVDLKEDGRFCLSMAAKDGSFSFDFRGIYTKIEIKKQINYTLDDNRKVEISFSNEGNQTIINESFEPEMFNAIDIQKAGWLAILESFKNYVESNESL